MRLNIGFPVVREGGRCTVTWLPNFLGWVDLLTHGAPQARFTRQSSAKKYSCYGVKKVHARNLITEKIPAARKFPSPPPPITFLMVRITAIRRRNSWRLNGRNGRIRKPYCSIDVIYILFFFFQAKKFKFRLLVKRGSEDKRRESLLQIRRQTLNEEKEKKVCFLITQMQLEPTHI